MCLSLSSPSQFLLFFFPILISKLIYIHHLPCWVLLHTCSFDSRWGEHVREIKSVRRRMSRTWLLFVRQHSSPCDLNPNPCDNSSVYVLSICLTRVIQETTRVTCQAIHCCCFLVSKKASTFTLTWYIYNNTLFITSIFPSPPLPPRC